MEDPKKYLSKKIRCITLNKFLNIFFIQLRMLIFISSLCNENRPKKAKNYYVPLTIFFSGTKFWQFLRLHCE